jgi:hypothetical protein
VVLNRLQQIPEVRSTQTVLIFEEAAPGQNALAPERVSETRPPR